MKAIREGKLPYLFKYYDDDGKICAERSAHVFCWVRSMMETGKKGRVENK